MPVDRFTRKETEGESRGGYRITCSTCPSHATVMPTNHGGTLPPEVTVKKFQRRGWTVGSKPSKDRCPVCTNAQPTASNVVQLPPQEAPMPATPAITREDRRIILSKLNDVYMSEELGYSPGWNDARVSEDLGVELSWVEQLRSDNFGDLPNSSQDDAMRQEYQQILDHLRDAEVQVREVMEDLAKSIEGLAEQRRAFERKYSNLSIVAA